MHENDFQTFACLWSSAGRQGSVICEAHTSRQGSVTCGHTGRQGSVNCEAHTHVWSKVWHGAHRRLHT
eukprot:scaffold98915_cov18-Tisochrysis_lutea.AAC.2